MKKKEIVGGIMPELKRPVAFLDLETTGTNTEKDMIVEICVLKVDLDLSEEVKTMRINPGIPIPKEASDVHGITDDMVKDQPTFAQIAKGLQVFLAGCDIVGFRSNKFDVPFLLSMFARAGIFWDWKSICLVDAGVIYTRMEERTLSAAVQFYLGRDHEGAHGAEADVRATKDIFIQQLAKYPNLGQDMEALQLYSNFDKVIVDMAGKFARNESGQIILTFGKHKDRLAHAEPGFLTWMLKADFPGDTKDIAAQILSGKLK